MEFFRGMKWDIIGRTKLWFTLSAVVIGLGIIVWAARGLNYGIDFTGGSLHRYAFEVPLVDDDAGVPAVLEKVRSLVTGMGLEGSQLQVVGDDSGKLTCLYIRAPEVANDEAAAKRDAELVAGLTKLFPEKGAITDLGRETVGPVVGKELQSNAILSLVIGWALILIYITVRYEFRFAVAGVIALVHDALVTCCLMAVFQIELDTSFVAAILTVVGYSINDSVIIFDRIRENMRLRRRADISETVNMSLLQTMARTVNTQITVVLTLLTLYFFGGTSLAGFSLALLFGIISGAYSSIFLAAPAVVAWEGRAARARAQALSAARAARPARATAGAGSVEETEEDAPSDRVSQESVIARLQQEDAQERQSALDEETVAQREARRERRLKEKRRKDKKRRF